MADRLSEQLVTAGFGSLEALLTARPGVSHVALANELGGEVTGVEITKRQLEGAFARGERWFRQAAKDLLVRELRDGLGEGWGRSTDPELNSREVNASVWAIWASQVCLVDETKRESTRAMFRKLSEEAPLGWLPENIADPLLVAAFDHAWPVAK